MPEPVVVWVWLNDIKQLRGQRLPSKTLLSRKEGSSYWLQ